MSIFENMPVPKSTWKPKPPPKGPRVFFHFATSREYTPGERVSGQDLLNQKRIKYYPKGIIEIDGDGNMVAIDDEEE